MTRRQWSDVRAFMRAALRSALLWQAMLVILPAAMLPGLAIYFLHQDKAAIEQQAAAWARDLAPELARRLGERAGELLKGRAASAPDGVILDGRIQSPPDYPPLPDPPDRLTSSEAKANAQFGSLVLESKGAVKPGFVQRCVDLAKTAPAARAESGAPVADLTLLLALRHAGPGRLPGELLAGLTRTVLDHPSFLTPELLQAAAGREIDQLKTQWDARERTLALMQLLAPRLAGATGPREIWLSPEGRPVLALCDPVQQGWRVTLWASAEFEETLRNALSDTRIHLQSFAGTTFEIGGRSWTLARAENHASVLASAPGLLASGSPHPFILSLDLADPNFYSSYRRRLWLAVGMMFSAAAAAMASLIGLTRNYQRQVALNKMKSNFVSSVSHELRAPIAAVRLMAESLDRGKIPEEARQKDYFRLIVQECRRLSSLVENVLDFSRIDQGRKKYNFEPVGVVALARQAVALMGPCAAERQVRLTLAELPPGAVDLQTLWDEHAVEQSLVNLLDNAIKHSPPGAEVKVEIELVGPAASGADDRFSPSALSAPEEADHKKRWSAPLAVRLWVEDHGEGIPKEEQARIFDLFYRHGSELRRETQGAGIGLSIVKHVAEAHGGRVIVQSAVGEGSRFALELPYRVAPAVLPPVSSPL